MAAGRRWWMAASLRHVEGDDSSLRSPESVTTRIAVEVSARVGGDASLTAVFVIVAGIVGAMAVPWFFRGVGVHDARARGLALGVAAHGIGTARAVALGAEELAFAALGIGLGGVVTPIVAPVVVSLLA